MLVAVRRTEQLRDVYVDQTQRDRPEAFAFRSQSTSECPCCDCLPDDGVLERSSTISALLPDLALEPVYARASPTPMISWIPAGLRRRSLLSDENGEYWISPGNISRKTPGESWAHIFDWGGMLLSGSQAAFCYEMLTLLKIVNPHSCTRDGGHQPNGWRPSRRAAANPNERYSHFLSSINTEI